MVSAGLGGGSLIYANVLIRKPEKWFVHHEPFGSGYESWPISRADLDPHYDAVQDMLDPQRFPDGKAGFERVRKAAAMCEAATALSLEHELPLLVVNFRPAPGTPPGVGLPLTDPVLILAAGSLGTTYLLLRNEKEFPGISDQLGYRFSGNGDFLVFVMRTHDENGRPRHIDVSNGPVITSFVRGRDRAEGANISVESGKPWLPSGMRCTPIVCKTMCGHTSVAASPCTRSEVHQWRQTRRKASVMGLERSSVSRTCSWPMERPCLGR